MQHGEPKGIEETRLICTTTRTPAVIQCQQECPSIVSPRGIRMSQCLSGCADLGRTCNSVTREFPEYSYIWWTDVIRNFSGIDPATNQPLLKNKSLYVPILSQDEFLFTVTCFVDRLDFPLGLNTVVVNSTPFQSMNLVLNGEASRPGVHCEGAPDVNLNSPKITIFMAPDVQNGQLVFTLSGAFDVDVDVTGIFGGFLDWIFGIGDRIVGRGDTQVNNLLDGNLKTGLSKLIVKNVVQPYIHDHAGQDVRRFLAVAVLANGLRIWYEPGSPNIVPGRPPTD